MYVYLPEENQVKMITEVGSRWLVQIRGRFLCTPCNNYRKGIH